MFALWEQVQAGSNETHPNTNSKILNHVNKKDVPVSRMQWTWEQRVNGEIGEKQEVIRGCLANRFPGVGVHGCLGPHAPRVGVEKAEHWLA